MNSKQSNPYNPIIKAISLFGGVQGLNILLNVVRTKFVAVLLGPEGVGLNTIYNETRELVHGSTNLGLDVSGVRGISAAYEEWTACTDPTQKEGLRRAISHQVAILRSWVLLLALVGALICMLFAAPLSLFTFGDYSHTWGYVLLSPAVAFSTITCGEMAVLKGLRRLRYLAQVSLLTILAGVVVVLPFYYQWGIDGVLAAILALCLVSMFLAQGYSFRAEPLQLVYTRAELREGHKMLSVGFNFVVSSILGHLALLGIQSYLNNSASLEMVGLYNAGYTLTMTYAGMIFAAMETDYFPRLSGLISHLKERNETLLRQQDVTLMLVAPLLALMLVALPVIVPMLLSDSFEGIIPMAQITTIGLLFRAIYLPNAYLPLAAGHNRIYLFINFIGALDILLVLPGYMLGGLFGMGVALTVQNLLDMLLVMYISHWKYQVVFTRQRLWEILLYTLFLGAVYLTCTLLSGALYWSVGTLLTVACCAYSVIRIKRPESAQ